MGKRIAELLLIFFRGLFMGAADIIPGVSGGTIALITGIYHRLIRGIDEGISGGMGAIRHLLKRDVRQARESFLKIDFNLFIPLILGIGIAFLSLSRIINYLLDEKAALTYSFFFGLILSSAIFVFRNKGKAGLPAFAMLAIGIISSFVFIGMNPIGANHTLPVIFGSGALAISAMLMPGISGSFILVFLGQYKFMLNALNTGAARELITFMAGAAAGVVVFSKGIDFLLKNYKTATLSFITGIMLGSLRLPYMEIASASHSALPVLLSGAIGFAIVLVIENWFKWTKR